MGEGVSTSLETLVWTEGLTVLALATRPGDAEERRVGRAGLGLLRAVQAEARRVHTLQRGTTGASYNE